MMCGELSHSAGIPPGNICFVLMLIISSVLKPSQPLLTADDHTGKKHLNLVCFQKCARYLNGIYYTIKIRFYYLLYDMIIQRCPRLVSSESNWPSSLTSVILIGPCHTTHNLLLSAIDKMWSHLQTCHPSVYLFISLLVSVCLGKALLLPITHSVPVTFTAPLHCVISNVCQSQLLYYLIAGVFIYLIALIFTL